MCFSEKSLLFLSATLLWLNITVCQATTSKTPECECRHDDAVEFVQNYYADLQENRINRISLALERWYPQYMPDHKSFIKKLEEIQYVFAQVSLVQCWQQDHSIVNVTIATKLRKQKHLFESKGIFRLICTTDGWKIFVAQRQTDEE